MNPVRMPALTIIAVSCATNAVLGWDAGYHAAGAYLVFWLLTALALVTAWNIASRAFADHGPLDRCVHVAILAFAVIVACGFALGAAGRLTIGGYLVAQTALLGASLQLPRSRPNVSGDGSRFQSTLRSVPAFAPTFVVAVVGALLAFAVGFATTHAPLTLYDSVSYHLFFSARWLQEHTLSIIPTPFSDEAQAYAPANGELFFAWLMLPFHGDLLARIGQFPFGMLAATTLYALARRLGAPPQHAIYPPAFYLLSRPILEQIIGANVDLVCAAMFLTSLYLGVVAAERNDRRDWMLWGVSLGLYWGSKYLALVYTPVVVLPAFARGPRVRALWALPGIAAFALPWYLRNWLVAGSPIYPASLAVAGVTLARGAFGRAAMLNTVFHTTDLRLFPVMAAHAFGPTLLLFWLPLVIIGATSMARRGWWPDGCLLVIAALMAPLYWFGFPVNIDSRFLMPAVGPSLLPFAFAFRDRKTWNVCLHGLFAAGMIWILIGLHAELPADVPWFMGGWLALNGLLTSTYVPWFVAVVILFAVAWRFGRMATQWTVPAFVAVWASASTVLALGGERWCRPSACAYLDATSPHIRPDYVNGWRWADDHVTDSTIAYTGINLPYPLTGPHLTNRVVYVNIDGRPRWRFHDYDRAYRTGRFAPEPPLLATSSGELLPVSRRAGPRDDAVRPRYERMQGIRNAWVFNLQMQSVRYLFVAALSPYEVEYVWHNDRGFPIEDEWAKADPQMFHLVYENPMARIYVVAPVKLAGTQR